MRPTLDIGENEFTSTTHQPAMNDSHNTRRLPSRNGHHVSHREGSDFGEAIESCSHPLTLLGVEVNALRVSHPLNVSVDVAKFFPRLNHPASDDDVNLD